MAVVPQQYDLDFGGVARLIRALMNPTATDPASPTDGEIWYNSTGGIFKVRRGGVTDTVAMMSDVTAGGISAALWDANSIVKADTDNTPVAMTVAASNVVGRRSTGAIAAIPYATLKTDLAITAADVGLGSAWNGDARPRSTHTGTQLSSTISDFNTAVDARAQAIVDTLIAGAPGALNTLDELAQAIGDDANFAATITTALGLRTRKFSANLGDGSATTINVPHALGTADVTVSFKTISSGLMTNVAWQTVDANNISAIFNTAPALNTVRVTVIG